jgi:hypothetical protein
MQSWAIAGRGYIQGDVARIPSGPGEKQIRRLKAECIYAVITLSNLSPKSVGQTGRDHVYDCRLLPHARSFGQFLELWGESIYDVLERMFAPGRCAPQVENRSSGAA